MTMASVPVALQFGGPRTEVSVAEATGWVSDSRHYMMSIGGAFVHTLNLSGRQWPLTTLQDEAFAPFLEEISTTVEVLKLDDMISSLETADGLALLAFLNTTFRDSPVQELCFNDNALGSRGAPVLRDLISRAKRLHLENCGISEEVAATLKEIIDTSTLTALATGRNQKGIGGARSVGAMLATCQNLESFSHKGSRPMLEGTTYLCQGLAAMSETNHRVLNLDLNDCLLSDDASVDFLVVFLKNSPHLRKLILRDCELKPSALVKILNALEGSRLVVLDLGGNDQVGEVAQELGAFLKSQVFSLDELHVDMCVLTQEGLAYILLPFTGEETCLKKLVLDDNGIGEAAGKVLLSCPIRSLEFLSLVKNAELPLEYAQQLEAMYPTIKRYGDDDSEEEVDDDELAVVSQGMGSLHV